MLDVDLTYMDQTEDADPLLEAVGNSIDDDIGLGSSEDVIKDSDRKWHGYSDYENVAVDLRKESNKAIAAYSHIQSCHSQGVGITPQVAVKAKRSFMRIARRLKYEVRQNAHVEEFRPIFERWEGVKLREKADGDWEIENDPDRIGYIERLERLNLRTESPRWLDRFIDDVVSAGWELGYIRAGVKQAADPDDPEQQVEEMFE